MLLLVTTAHPDMIRYAHPNLGRLVQPRHYSTIQVTSDSGITWAADNDCFQGFKEAPYVKMMEDLRGMRNCRFATVPDVVGDHLATFDYWLEWHEYVGSIQPPAFVLQDGVRLETVPWEEVGAIFIGGTTEFKLGPVVREIVKEAKRQRLWVHMGRVNSYRRLSYAASIGCDSVDGSKYPMFKETYLRDGLKDCAALTEYYSNQLSMISERECDCEEECFLCAMEGMNGVPKIDPNEQAILYWAERMGVDASSPVLRDAVKDHGVQLCNEAYARVVDKEYHASNPDLTEATRVRNRAGLFIHILKGLVEDANRARHNRRMQAQIGKKR